MMNPAVLSHKHTVVWIWFFAIIAVSYSLYTYATMSVPATDKPEVQWLKSIPIAHRGLHTNNSQVPENSLLAFEKAIIEGYAIELDVQLSADDKVVVFHDESLERMTGIDKNLEDCTWEELSKLRLLDSKYAIPSFSQVLQLVNGKVPILIEIKNNGKVGGIEQAVYNEIKDYKGKLAVQSFNPYSLKWFRQNAPHIIRGQLSGSFKDEDLAGYKKFMLKNLLLNFESKPAFIAYEIEALPKLVVSKQSHRGCIVLGWAARSSEQYRKALKYCDNVIFEGLSPKEEIE